MTDWYCHVLPGMDEGCATPDESAEFLSLLGKQGVTSVMAAPHFYPGRETPEAFFARRNRAEGLLADLHGENFPKIISGAEVSFYRGVTDLSFLPELSPEGSGLLYLEMPFCRWTEEQLRELLSVRSRFRLSPVLTHVERYFLLQPPDLWSELSAQGVYLQMNLSVPERFLTRRIALRLMREKLNILPGSDGPKDGRPSDFSGFYGWAEKHLEQEEFLCLRNGPEILLQSFAPRPVL